MDELLNELMSPGSWTQTQWLALGLALLMLIGAGFFCYLLYRIIKKELTRPAYKPNIGRSRLYGRQGGKTEESE